MADDEQVSNFVAFTGATPEHAQRYLQLSDDNLEAAVELYFSNPDLGNTSAAPVPAAPAQSNRDAPINVDSEDDDDDVQVVGSRPARNASVEDDEAMARRLQEEMYGGGGGNRAGGGGDFGEEDVRAPMARTTETLVGPGSFGGGGGMDWRDNPGQMNAAIADQLFQREQRTRRGAPGLFNQSQSSSIWAQDDPSNPEAHRQALARATGGASETSAKSNLLADLFRPPVDLITALPLADARDLGKETEKWILVNVQDPSIFDCQVLNRDIWKNESIRETIKEHFIFLQYNKNDPRGADYVNYYFSNHRDNDDAYPHIAIIDPRTGEQVKTWSGSPAPKSAEFLMELHEFLDRYSLKMEKKNPVQAKRKEAKKSVAAMTEEEMLELALQNSMANGSSSAAPKEEDPDALTRPAGTTDKGKERATEEAMDVDEEEPKEASAFSRISSSNAHEEPTSTDPKETTRIQFRHSGGRVIRRFNLSDPVQRIYEWLKASPIEGKEGQPFELVAMGKNLIEQLDTPIGEAGLKNGTVMVEFVEED